MTSSPGRLPEIVARRRAEATVHTVRTLGQIGELGVRAAVALAPEGPTRNYVEGIDATSRASGGDLSTTIGARAPHSHIVERGRRAGKMPPVRKIATLFGISRSQAFVVARAIGRRGSAGHHVLERTADSIRPQVRALAAQLAAKVGGLR